MAASNGMEPMIRVWDPLIRIGHWVLVAAFATAYLTEGEPQWLHTWAGYAIAVIVALRIVWGFVGPRRARFSDFFTGPARALSYLRDLVRGRAERHVGHSPAGGVMVVALLVALATTAVTGMGTLAVEKGRGPLAGIVAPVSQNAVTPVLDDDHDGRRGRKEDAGLWKEVHEVAANLTLILVLLHVGGVILASFAHRENLVRAMVTGDKRA